MAWESRIEEHARRKRTALAMGSTKRLAERAEAGILNARQRIDYLLDDGSFHETGLFATSERAGMAEKSPGDGVVDGYGRIDGREVVVCAQDFTTLGSSSAVINGKKSMKMWRTAEKNGVPFIYLSECSGARIPDIMGAVGMGRIGEGFIFSRRRLVPWADALMGQSFGGGTWVASVSDFLVMRKGSVMAVTSPRVNTVAISEQIDPEEMGGWRVQTEITGKAAMAVDTDEEALDAVRRFLSYMPSNCEELPPRLDVPAGSGDDAGRILDMVPEERRRTYDVRKVLALVVDRDSLFPIKERFGRSLVTALARIDGRPVGIIANNPMFKGGALDVDSCDKATEFIALCDSFNLPLIFFADVPGFLIGIEGEHRKVPGKIMNFMQALELASVPKLSIVMRKSYGQAYINMGGGRSDEMACWFTADISFVDPEVAASIVTGAGPKENPELFAKAVKEYALGCSPYELAQHYMAHDVIDPRETRTWLARMLAAHQRRRTRGIGDHLMQNWPFTY
ncbi:MAG: carboxyl transferase domain-containing protein [Pseudomonadota bacterium]|nr:carboxyl transferase domain-containing protein [Pseudomonadota bacterium]